MHLFRYSLIGMMVVLLPILAFAQKDQIEGKWLNEDKDAKIEIYLTKSGTYAGRIAWLKEPNRNGKPKMDENNQKESLRKQPILGLVLLKGFKKEGNTYDDGTIYDPKNGKTYDCTITYKNANTLSIRGYIGISMLGRTTTWTRSD